MTDNADGIGNRVQRLLGLFKNAQTPETVHEKRSAASEFAALTQRLAKASNFTFTPSMWRQLASLARRALRDAINQAMHHDPDNTYAHEHAMEAMRSQLRQLLAPLNPPPEFTESADFQTLMELLYPAAKKHHESGVAEEAVLKGKVRTDVMNRQVSEAIAKADEHATKRRVDSLKRTGMEGAAIASAMRTLFSLVKVLKKKQKALAKAADDPSDIAAPEPITQEEVDELSQKALEVMRTIREEFAPRWAPAQQPWFVNAADQEVFSIVLAVIPQELFQQTQAYGDMQKLRSGDQVFTLRASDKLAEAVKRK